MISSGICEVCYFKNPKDSLSHSCFWLPSWFDLFHAAEATFLKHTVDLQSVNPAAIVLWCIQWVAAITSAAVSACHTYVLLLKLDFMCWTFTHFREFHTVVLLLLNKFWACLSPLGLVSYSSLFSLCVSSSFLYLNKHQISISCEHGALETLLCSYICSVFKVQLLIAAV